MGTLERTVTYKHILGPAGRLTIKGVAGPIEVIGVEGDEARLRVRYRVRAVDQASAERALEQGSVKVDQAPESLTVETPERSLSAGLAWLFGGSRVSIDLFAEVPFATRVHAESVSGSIDGSRLTGEQRYRTISGDVHLNDVSGRISTSTVSGSAYADASAEVRLSATSVSGSLRVQAPLFDELKLSTTSGEISIEGELLAHASYRADSVSGSCELITASGVVAELKTLSGRIVSEVEHRMQGGRGQWRAIVGDGAAAFRFNTTSGQLRIRRPMGARTDVSGSGQASSATAAGTAASAQSNQGADRAVPAGVAGSQQDESAGIREAVGAAGTDPVGATSPDAWRPDPSDAESDPAADGQHRESELEVLRAVERGELTVEEAAARLERIRR